MVAACSRPHGGGARPRGSSVRSSSQRQRARPGREVRALASAVTVGGHRIERGASDSGERCTAAARQ